MPLIADVQASSAEDKIRALVALLKKKVPCPVIEKHVGREVLDSRGSPAVEVAVREIPQRCPVHSPLFMKPPHGRAARAHGKLLRTLDENSIR
jgi:hypothetical protein